MTRVDFIFNNGTKRGMHRDAAELLVKHKQGSYMTRDMTADRTMTLADNTQDLDSMSKEELMAAAKRRGLKVHPLSGVEKLRAALRA